VAPSPTPDPVSTPAAPAAHTATPDPVPTPDPVKSPVNGADATANENPGFTGVAVVDGHYSLYDPEATDGSGGTTLKFLGMPLGPVPGKEPVAAEKTETGYEVAWKVGPDQYNIWDVDSDGRFVKSETSGNVSGDSISLQFSEMVFHQDINGDGVTGLDAQNMDQLLGSLKTALTGLFSKSVPAQQSDTQSVAGQSASTDSIGTDLLQKNSGSLLDPKLLQTNGSSSAISPGLSQAEPQSGATSSLSLTSQGQSSVAGAVQADTSHAYGQRLTHQSDYATWSDSSHSGNVLQH